jgi:hypothetical protein
VIGYVVPCILRVRLVASVVARDVPKAVTRLVARGSEGCSPKVK